MVSILAALLWVVPSLGTQGMATVGRRAIHTDAMILARGAVTPPAGSQAVLERSDRFIETALGL